MSIWLNDAGRDKVLSVYQGILSAWPVPNSQRLVPTSWGDTFVIDCGPREAPAIVLLHGAMSNSFTWLPDIPALVQGYRVVAVDLIGDAGLSAPSRPDYASGAYATWLSEVLDVLRIQQCAIAGLSLGGWVGMEFATTHPELVDQLILLAPGGLAAVNHAFLVKQQSQPDHAATMRAVMGDMEPGSVMAKAFEFMILIAENFVPRYDPLPVFTPERLGRLTMPTLVVYGEHDNLLDAPASLANARAGIPEVTTVTLPGVGHAVVGQAKRMLSFIAPGIDQTGHPDRKP